MTILNWKELSSSVAICCALVMASGCGSSSNAPDNTPQDAEAPNGSMASPSSFAAPPVPRYTPQFDDREGDTYFYASGVSEEDEKKGRTLGDVSSFRYLGERDGKHRIATVDEDGEAFAVYECPTACRIIKRTYRGQVERIPYNPRSVIGAAFEDALHGSLRVAHESKRPEQRQQPDSATIPREFVGEWNADLAACGTGLHDSRLRIEPKRVRFYESDGEVRRVTILNERAIKVAASFAGEGEVWTDEVQFVLSRSGDQLSSGDVTRHRCPA